MLEKLDEGYSLARERKCDFAVFGGDLYNTHRIYSYDVIGKVQDIICGSGIDTYAVVGQHDLRGYNPKTLETSALGFTMRRCDSFKTIWEPIEVGDCMLFASHVWDDINEANDAEGSDKFNILVAHHLLTNKKAMFDVVNTREFTQTGENGCPFQLVLSGDLHDGYEPHEENGVWFCNPGSLARRATSDAHRMPQVAIIDVHGPRVPPGIEIVRLKCGRPGDEVFGEGIAEVMRKRDDSGDGFDAEAFVADMESFEMESENIHDLVHKMGKKKGLRKEVLAYLDSKREEKVV
jgi:DNA repair exonuclease SbcCD nuclease subunit